MVILMGIAVLSVTCSGACEAFVDSGVIHVLLLLVSLSYTALPGYARRVFVSLLHSSLADELTDRDTKNGLQQRGKE